MKCTKLITFQKKVIPNGIVVLFYVVIFMFGSQEHEIF